MQAKTTPDLPDTRRDLVVIGASAGGVETLKRVVADLPADLRATICIVLHIAPGSPSALAGILRRAGRLPCRPATDGEPLIPGEILVAPPDRHLVIEDGRVRLTIGPRENNHRPAVDALFRSAAIARGERVIGIILSGTRDDGTAGLAVIKAQGGLAIVQDPADAIYPGMPTSALDHVAVDAVVPSGDIGGAIAAMVNGTDPPPENDPQPTSGSARTGPYDCDLPRVRGRSERANRSRHGAVEVPRGAPLLARDADRCTGRGRRGRAVDGDPGAV